MGKKILVCGVGVIGSVYALRLAKAGHDVHVLARGERLQAIRETGLHIHQIFLNEEESAEVGVLEEVNPGDRYDMVLVVVRSGQISKVLEKVATLSKPQACLVLGNNLGDYAEQEAIVGSDCFILGFGAFGGYREGGTIVYLDGRSKKNPDRSARTKTTLGIISQEASAALDMVRNIFDSAGLPWAVCDDMPSWLLCHAALVFPLAGGMYAAGGDQERVCRTRDAAVLGIRACKELLKALRSLGYRIEPKRLKTLLRTPEPFLVRMVMKALTGEGARVAMFAHANAPGGRSEISGQAMVLDTLVRSSGRNLPSWERLIPYFQENPPALLPDGSRSIAVRLF